MNGKSQIPDSWVCTKCKIRHFGFAQCHNPSCFEIRKEFEGYKHLITPQFGRCVISGAETDLELPNGDYLWAPYFLQYMETGWLNDKCYYTDAYYEAHPNETWRDFIYREFWDYPREILFRYKNTYYLKSPFDDNADEYPDIYTLYLMPDLKADVISGSWINLEKIAINTLGRIPIGNVTFDETRRKKIDIGFLSSIK